MCSAVLRFFNRSPFFVYGNTRKKFIPWIGVILEARILSYLDRGITLPRCGIWKLENVQRLFKDTMASSTVPCGPLIALDVLEALLVMLTVKNNFVNRFIGHCIRLADYTFSLSICVILIFLLNFKIILFLYSRMSKCEFKFDFNHLYRLYKLFMVWF